MTMTQTNSSPSGSEKLYYRIGDVAAQLGVKPYVLRYWESEFAFIHPQKSPTGQRVYKRSDVESIFLIRHLLYIERYSVEGARKRLNELRKNGELQEYKKNALKGTPLGPEGSVAWVPGDRVETAAQPTPVVAEPHTEPEPQGEPELVLSPPVEEPEVLTPAPVQTVAQVRGVSEEKKKELRRLAQELHLLSEAPLTHLFRA
jgi:DNA-binding transcriptional MerR regulator